MITASQFTQVLAQYRRCPGTSRVAEMFHIAPMMLFRNVCTVTDAAQCPQIGLMTHKDKSFAV